MQLVSGFLSKKTSLGAAVGLMCPWEVVTSGSYVAIMEQNLSHSLEKLGGPTPVYQEDTLTIKVHCHRINLNRVE